MKKLLCALAITATLLLSSCVPSVQPLYTEADLVFDPALVGAWGDPGGKESWTFEKSGEKEYKLSQKDDHGRTAEFSAHPVKLKEHLFLDLFLVDPGADEEWKVNGHAAFAMVIRPAHLFLRVRQIEPSLKLAYLDPDWLEKLLEKDPKAIRHEKTGKLPKASDERIVLTADTKDLQEFILRNVNEAFGKADDEGLIRKKPGK